MTITATIDVSRSDHGDLGDERSAEICAWLKMAINDMTVELDSRPGHPILVVFDVEEIKH